MGCSSSKVAPEHPFSQDGRPAGQVQGNTFKLKNMRPHSGASRRRAQKPIDPARYRALKTLNSKIEKRLSKELVKPVQKALFLGTGESGKSTVFKQMRLCYGDSFNEFERMQYSKIIWIDALRAMRILVDICDEERMAPGGSPALKGIVYQWLGVKGPDAPGPETDPNGLAQSVQLIQSLNLSRRAFLQEELDNSARTFLDAYVEHNEGDSSDDQNDKKKTATKKKKRKLSKKKSKSKQKNKKPEQTAAPIAGPSFTSGLNLQGNSQASSQARPQASSRGSAKANARAITRATTGANTIANAQTDFKLSPESSQRKSKRRRRQSRHHQPNEPNEQHEQTQQQQALTQGKPRTVEEPGKLIPELASQPILSQAMAGYAVQNDFQETMMEPRVKPPRGVLLTRENVVKTIQRLWRTCPEPIRMMVTANQLGLETNAAFFLSKIQDFEDENYLAANEDILHARIKTTGITTTEFNVKSNSIIVTDVGGQRVERKKWIYSFDDVTCLLFVASVSEYDQGLEEEEAVNRLDESLAVFQQTVNSQWFRTKSVQLFLNKVDILKVKCHYSSFKAHFPGYRGNDKDPDDIMRYIESLFRERFRGGNRNLYVHRTCATDTTTMKFVVDAVSDMILFENMKWAGML